MGTDDYTTVGGEELRRDTVVVDGDEHRMYYSDDASWPSVSTVLDARPTPAKDKQIQGWRNWLNGQPDRPDPSDVLRYKSQRGTLAHYKALQPFAAYDLAGDEEFEAYQSLDGWEYQHDDALRQARDDVEWVVEQVHSQLEDLGVAQFDDGELVHSNVREVEQYVVDRDVGYAGQFDAAVELPDGRTALCDIKTSKADSVSGLFDKKFPRYGLQLGAYARAAPLDVDACYVLWAAPDTRESAIIPDSEWPQSLGAYDEQFRDLVADAHETTFDDITLDEY